MIKTVSSKDVGIEVYAKPESINNKDGDYALNEAKQIIDFFSDYFDVPYPLNKSSKLEKLKLVN